MKVIHKLTVHLDDRHIIPCIDAVQGDAYTRVLELTLYSGGVAWNVPEGVSIAVAYDGASGKGIYNTLPDGSAACAAAGNVVTAVVVPQALSMPGETKLTVVFTDGNGGQLAAFCVTLKVEKNPAVGASGPSDYINMRQWMTDELSVLLEELDIQGSFRVYVTKAEDGSYISDYGDSKIYEELAAGKRCFCIYGSYILPLTYRFGGRSWFTALVNGKEVRVVVSDYDVKVVVDGFVEVDATLSIEGQAADAKAVGDSLAKIKGSYLVDVFPAGAGYATEEKFADILEADKASKTVVCELELDSEQAHLLLPLVKRSDTAVHFSAVVNGEELRVEIDAEDKLTFYREPVGGDGAGADGYTPVKGVDYYTEADKAELVARVLAALPDGTEVTY